MDTKTYSVYNPSTESYLSSGVTVINTRMEPLKVLRVMIDGLALNAETGLWLTPFDGIPQVPRLSPFDLIYLDTEGKILQGAELLPGEEMLGYNGEAASALVLPYKSLTASKTVPGHRLRVQIVEEPVVKPEPPVTEEANAPVAAETEPPAPAEIDAPAIAEPEAPVVAEAEPAVVAEISALTAVPDLAPEPPLTAEPAFAEVAASLDASVSESEEQKEAAAEKPEQITIVEVVLGEWEEAERPLESAFPLIEEAQPAPRALDVAIPEAIIADAEAKPEAQPVESAAAPAPASPPDAETAEQLDRDSSVAPSKEAEVPAAEEVPIARQGQETETQGPAPIDVPAPVPTVAAAELPEQISIPPVLPPAAPGEALRAEPALETRPVVQSEPAAPPAKPQAASVPKPELKPAKKEPGAESETSPREHAIVRFLRWLDPTLVNMPERRRNLRRRMPALTAYRWINGIPKQHRIGNISSTGIYLYTEDSLPSGELVTLSLQVAGPPEKDPERRVTIRAKTVRRGENGIGLRFVLPSGMDLRLWEGEVKSDTDIRRPEYVVNEIRLAKALAFVGRICPQVSKGVEQLLKKELSTYRTASSVEIALRAEELLAHRLDAGKMHAHPAVVLRVLESGSWSEFEFVRVFWAGLLATACTVEGNDESSLPFVEMLGLLTSMHLRILIEVCAQATKLTSDRGQVPSKPMYWTTDEMMKIAGSNDMVKMDRAVALLGDIKLIDTTPRSHFYSYREAVKATPTRLGLELIARCNGHRLAP